MNWNVKGEFIETCSCNMLCPCWYGVKELMVMDQGWCASAFLIRIREGTFEGVDIGGRSLAMITDFPGPTLLDGNGIGRLYFEDDAGEEQVREIEAIFQGKKGGPMIVLGGLISNWMPSVQAKIEIREEEGMLSADVGEFGRIKSGRLNNEAGQPMTMQNVGFAVALEFDDQTAQLAPSDSRWLDPEMPRQFDTKSGAAAAINWSVG